MFNPNRSCSRTNGKFYFHSTWQSPYFLFVIVSHDLWFAIWWKQTRFFMQNSGLVYFFFELLNTMVTRQYDCTPDDRNRITRRSGGSITRNGKNLGAPLDPKQARRWERNVNRLCMPVWILNALDTRLRGRRLLL